MDPEYFAKEGKKDRKGKLKFSFLSVVSTICNNFKILILSLVLVFAQVLAGFRYGRDDLDVLGLNFRRDLIDVRIKCAHTYMYNCTYIIHTVQFIVVQCTCRLEYGLLGLLSLYISQSYYPRSLATFNSSVWLTSLLVLVFIYLSIHLKSITISVTLSIIFLLICSLVVSH